jgi:hypothetical protein
MLGADERLGGTADFSQQSPTPLTKVIATQDSSCSHFSEHSSAVAAWRGLRLKLNPWSLIPGSIGPMRRVGTGPWRWTRGGGGFSRGGGLVVCEVGGSCGKKNDRSLSKLEITTPIRVNTPKVMATQVVCWLLAIKSSLYRDVRRDASQNSVNFYFHHRMNLPNRILDPDTGEVLPILAEMGPVDIARL